MECPGHGYSNDSQTTCIYCGRSIYALGERTTNQTLPTEVKPEFVEQLIDDEARRKSAAIGRGRS